MRSIARVRRVHKHADVFRACRTDLLSNPKKLEVSAPYDPVHLTHVGFNSNTGEFTGLPREWQLRLQASGISKQEQEAHPQAVQDIVAFYQDATKHDGEAAGSLYDDVWTKFSHVNESSYENPVGTEDLDLAGLTLRFNSSFLPQRAAPAPPPRQAPAAPYATPPMGPGSPAFASPPMSPASRPPPPLERTQSQRLPPRPPPPVKSPGLDRSSSQRASPRMPPQANPQLPTSPQAQPRAPSPAAVTPSHARAQMQPSPAASSFQPSRPPPPRPNIPPPRPPVPPGLNASPSLSSAGQAVKKQAGQPGAVPRKREQKPKVSDEEIVARLKSICTDADPTKLYRNLHKIGQGCVRELGTPSSV